MLMLLLLMPTSHCAILWIFAHCVIRIVAYFVHFCRREREKKRKLSGRLAMFSVAAATAATAAAVATLLLLLLLLLLL